LYKSPLHIESYLSDNLSHRDLSGALTDAGNILAATVEELEMESVRPAAQPLAIKQETKSTDCDTPQDVIMTDSATVSNTSSIVSSATSNTSLSAASNLWCGCSVNNSCSLSNPFCGNYTVEEDRVAITFITALKEAKEIKKWSFALHDAWNIVYTKQTPMVHFRTQRSLYDRYKIHPRTKAKLLELKAQAGNTDEKTSQAKANREARKEGPEMLFVSGL
jgi:hypothetical protein